MKQENAKYIVTSDKDDGLTLYCVCLGLNVLGGNCLARVSPRSCKRNETLFKSLLFWLAGEVSWLAVEVLSPCQK